MSIWDKIRKMLDEEQVMGVVGCDDVDAVLYRHPSPDPNYRRYFTLVGQGKYKLEVHPHAIFPEDIPAVMFLCHEMAKCFVADGKIDERTRQDLTSCIAILDWLLTQRNRENCDA